MTYEDWGPVFQRTGLGSEMIGPLEEWSPVPQAIHQRRHDAFWSLVSHMIEGEPGDYEQLPVWMTEDVSEQLRNN